VVRVRPAGALGGGAAVVSPQSATYAVAGNIRLVDTGEGERIALAYLPNPSARFTILFFHGNGSQLGKDLPFLADLRNEGFAVAAIDYRGYGASEGHSSVAAIGTDARAAIRWLGRRRVRQPAR